MEESGSTLPNQEKAAPSASRSGQSLNLSILLVEDNPQDAILLEEAIREGFDSFDITKAHNGEEALRLIYSSEVRPDFILLDLNLPLKTGLEVLQELKEDLSYRSIPIIVMTNSKSDDDVRAAYTHHCNAYVRKPVGFEKLSGTMSRIIQFWGDCAYLPSMATPE